MFGRGRMPVRQRAKVGLPEQRKALVERYMIDAEEAQSRTLRAAEEHARRRAAEEAALPTATATQRDAVEPEPRASAKHDAANETASPAPAAEREPEPTAEDLPIYVWVQQTRSTSPADSDWPQALVRSREARTREARST